MRKQEFIYQLWKKLSDLPKEEVEERLSFYGEMIDDRMEEGLSEEEAVAAVGTVEEIAANIAGDIPLTKIAKEKIKPNRSLKAWEVVLLVLGSPVWLSLLVAAFAVIFSLYASLWAVIVSLWAAFGAIVASAFGCVVAGVIFAITGNVLSGIAITGSGIILAGISIFLFFGCKAVTKGIVWLTKNMGLLIRKCFIKKEEV